MYPNVNSSTRVEGLTCPQCGAGGGVRVGFVCQGEAQEGGHFAVAWRPVLTCETCTLWNVGYFAWARALFMSEEGAGDATGQLPTEPVPG